MLTLYSPAATFTIHLLPLLAHSASLNTKHGSPLTSLDVAVCVRVRDHSKSRPPRLKTDIHSP